MFGFGFGKLIVLALIVAAVWYGFKLVSRFDRQRKEKLAENREKTDPSVGKMAKCPVCSTYVLAEQASNCGRQGCPY